MKLPEYTLKKEVLIPTGTMSDPIKFPPGTLVMPFSEVNLPDHIKEQLKEHLKFVNKSKEKEYIMCLIGSTWVPIHKEDIRRN